jgi:hypothetical protein
MTVHTTDQPHTPGTPPTPSVARLLAAVEHTLDRQADDSLPIDVDRLLARTSRAHHGGHCGAVHTEVRDTIRLLGTPQTMTGADLLREVRAALRLLGGAR